MTEYRLDRKLIEALEAGTLDAEGEGELAEQVARIMPYHWTLPNPYAAALSRLTDHLGGEEGLLAWLEAHPDRPRLVARLYGLIGLLDAVSMEPAVVTALSEVRARDPFPFGIQGHLTAETTGETLANLSLQIEELLAETQDADAVQLATAVTSLLELAGPRVGELDPKLADLGERAVELRREILNAWPI